PESAYPRPSVPAGWPRSAARSQCQYQGLCIGPAFAAGIFRKPRGGGTARFQKQTPRLRLPESQSRVPRTQSQLLPVFCPDKRQGHSCPESSPVLRFDLFKFLVDDLLYPQRLPVEMGQFARTCQPGLARPSTSLGELFFDCLRHVLAQRNSQCTGGGLGLAEGGVRDFQRSLHNASIPYLWDSRSAGFVRTRRKGSSLSWGLLSNRLELPIRSNEINWIAEIWNKNNWLPIVDAFRTFVACPPPSMRAVFQSLVLVMVPWGQPETSGGKKGS